MNCAPQKPAWQRGDLAFGLCLLGLGLMLRLPGLRDIPSPAGDEAGWLDLAVLVTRGEPAVFSADAAFVTPLFAWLIALPVWCFGTGFGAARLVPALAVTITAVLVYALCARQHLRKLGIFLALALLLHPWSLAWSRTVGVPYALALCLAVLGVLGWLAALDVPRPVARTLALIGAGQVLVLGLHFSPLAGLPLVACALWLLVDPRSRTLLRTPGPWLALLAVLLHAWPIVTMALSVVGHSGGSDPGPLWPRVAHFLLVGLDGISGEATVRHLAQASPAWLGLLRGVVGLALLAAVVRVARRPEPHGRFALLYLAVAVPGLALLLVPARNWWLPTIDAERYMFALLAPTFLVAGAALTTLARWRSVTAATLALFAVLPSVRLASTLLLTGGVDSGLYVETGGGWRGWKVDASLRGMPRILRDDGERWAGGEPTTLLLDDWFGLSAVRPLLAARPETPLEIAWIRHADGTDKGLPALASGRRVLVPLWPDELFAPGFQPEGMARWSHDRRAAIRAQLKDVQLVETVRQPGGRPLLQWWRGRMP